MERWFCLDENKVVDLNQHGYCGSCGSNSVVSDQLENRILEQFPKRVPNENYTAWLDRLRREAAIATLQRDEQRRLDDLDRNSGVFESDES